MQSHGRWHLLALQSEHANITWGLASASITSWQQLMKIMFLIEGIDKESDLVYFMIITK